MWWIIRSRINGNRLLLGTQKRLPASSPQGMYFLRMTDSDVRFLKWSFPRLKTINALTHKTSIYSWIFAYYHFVKVQFSFFFYYIHTHISPDGMRRLWYSFDLARWILFWSIIWKKSGACLFGEAHIKRSILTSIIIKGQIVFRMLLNIYDMVM